MAFPVFVVFDLDQTLIESRTIWPSWRQALMEAGCTEEEARKAYESGIGKPTRETALALGKFEGAAADAIVNRYKDLLGDGDPAPLPGVPELLAQLAERGVPCFLTTGTDPGMLARILAKLGWSDVFARALGSTDALPKGAPHYEAFALSQGMTRAAFAQAAIAVGDGRADMENAKEAGVPVRCGILSPLTGITEPALTAAGATVVIRSMGDLLPIVDEALSRKSPPVSREL